MPPREIHTVTVPYESRTLLVDDDVILAKTIHCTCGWSRSIQVLRAEAKGRHHLLYEHGGGNFVYAGTETDVKVEHQD